MFDITIPNKEKLILPIEAEIQLCVLQMNDTHTTYRIDIPFATADYQGRLRRCIEMNNAEL